MDSETLTFKIDDTGVDSRLDTYLASQIQTWSRARLKRLIENEDVVVNGRSAKASYKLRKGDEVEVELVASPAEVFEPQNIPLDIVHEDEVMIVVNKPAGLVVHPASGIHSGTLANALSFHLQNLPASA